MSKKPKLKKDLILEVAQLQKRVKELETAKADDNLGDVLPTSEQSKMEQMLRESEDRWRTLAESSPDHILILTPDLIIEYANFASPGLTIDDIIGKNITKFLDDKKQEEVSAILKGVLTTGNSTLYETEYLTPDGGVIYYETHAILRKTNDIVLGLTLSSRDITERKQAEKKLIDNEDLLNATQQITKVGGWKWNVENETMFWTDETYRIHELDPTEFTAGSIEHIARGADCYDEKDRPIILAAFQKCVDEGIPYDLELPLTTYRGSRIWIRTTAQPEIEDGKVVAVIGNIVDITKRKLAEEEDQHRREELSIFLKTSQALNKTLELDIVLQTTTDSASELLNVDSVAIYLLEGDELFLGATTPALDPQMPDYLRRAALSDHPHILSAVSSQQIVILDDARSSDLNEHEKAIADMRGLITIAFIPIIFRQLILGILILGSTGTTRIFSDLEINLGKTLANQIAGGLHNAIMHEEAKQHSRDLETQIAERIKLEIAFTESEKKFRGYVETSQDLIWECDSEGKFIYLNPAWEGVTGYKLSEMLNKPFTDFTIPEEVEENSAEFARHLEGGFVEGYPSTYIAKNGAEINLIFNAIPVLDDNKTIIGTQGSAYDITELKQAEKEKTHSRNLLLSLSQAAQAVQRASTAEEIYRAIGEQVGTLGFNATVFTLSDDKKHLIVSYNSLTDLAGTIEKLTGLTAMDYSFLLKTEGYFHKIITGNKTVYSYLEIEPIEETLPKVLRSHAKKIMSLFGRQQSIIAPLAVSGVVHGLLTISGSDLSESDIPAITTFANQAAIALEKTRLFQETEDLAAFNESIIRNMAEGIVLQDAEGIITFVNPAAAKMLDYTSEEWIGKHWTEIVPPDQQPIIQKADERRILGESDRYELELVNKDGQRISVLVGGSPRFDGEGQFAGTMAVFTDITERKRTEEKISRFSRIFEDSLNEIFLFEPDTLKFTQVNSAGQNNLGYSMEELYDLTPLDIKPEVTAESFEYLIAPLRENKTDRVVFETVHQRKDGSLYNVEVHLQLLRYENESLFSAIILDITERYQAELESKRYIRRLDSLLNIDQAIMGSFDLQVTLNVILEHLISQLAIDAVAVLSYHSDLQTLNFTQGRGFQTPALQYTDLRLGEGYAGEVGLQRDHIFIPDLTQAEGKFKESPLFSQEGFVSYYGIPLLAKGKLVGVLEIFNRSDLDPGEEWVNYLRLLAGQVAIAIDNISMFNDLQRTNVDLTLSYDATIEGWARALELKDMETEGHSRRVVEMTLAMARRMGISGENLGHIRRGALLHDIGKMGIPDSILQKPGKLSDEEWQIMKQHPVYAYEWLSPIQYLRHALDIPYAHHERWDGTGYPRGLEGEQIPLAARIFAIVDVWDALNSDRPYRKAWPAKKILDHIGEQSGKHFDPGVVDSFIEQVTGQ